MIWLEVMPQDVLSVRDTVPINFVTLPPAMPPHKALAYVRSVSEALSW